jgi:hypothetical protein
MYRETVDKHCHIDKTQLNSPEEGEIWDVPQFKKQ